MRDQKNESLSDEVEEETSSVATLENPLFGSVGEVINRYTHCLICGGNLHFTHFTDFSRNLTQEVAKCPECGVRARNVLHRLQ